MRTNAISGALLAALFTSACEGGNGMRAARPCSEDTRAETYVAGLEKTVEESGLEVSLLEAMPAPPDRGDNVWRLSAKAAGGAPLERAGVSLRTWMPDHGHGTTPLMHEGRASEERGVYEIGPFNLFMPGLWELTISVTSSAATGSTEFAFCVEG